jgi:hypothetical protein
MSAALQHATWEFHLREALSNFIDLVIRRELCALSSGRIRIYQRDDMIPKSRMPDITVLSVFGGVQWIVGLLSSVCLVVSCAAQHGFKFTSTPTWHLHCAFFIFLSFLTSETSKILVAFMTPLSNETPQECGEARSILALLCTLS